MQPIAIFDSGIGGLSLYKTVKKLLPNEDYIYIADKKYFPYGEQSASTITDRIFALSSWALTHNAKMLVLACNTATVTAVRNLRKKYPEVPVIGMVPVIKTCSEQTKNGNIGVLCTPRTARSAYQKQLIARFADNKKVYVRSCSGLVEAIETANANEINTLKTLMRSLNYLKNKDIDTLALGCSHFPLISDKIMQVMGDSVRVLDSSGAVARHIKRVLKNNNMLHKTNHRGKTFFYTTHKPGEFDIILKKQFELKNKSRLIRGLK